MAETALSGSDVLTEIISANDRKQGGIRVYGGGLTAGFSTRDNTLRPGNLHVVGDAQVAMDKLDSRFVRGSNQGDPIA